MKYKYRHQELYKDVRIDVKSNSKSDLIRKVQNKKDKIDRQTVDEQIRLDDFCTLYLETYKRPTVSASWYNDLTWIKNKLVDFIGNKQIGKITPIEVQAFLNSCAYMSDSTIKKIYDFTKQIFDHAQKNGATSYRFDLSAPKGRKKRSGRSLTEHEQEVLVNAIKGHRGELFVLIMLYCGLRPAEVSALNWKDIDLENNIISVNKSLKKDGSIGTPKTLAGVREVPIPYKLSVELQKHVKSPFKAVCEQSNGRHTKSSIRKMWQAIKKEVEKDLLYEFDYRLYDLRHTYCTNLEKQGVPINIASRLMGHSDISITSKIYTHASAEAIEIARKCIDKETQKETSA